MGANGMIFGAIYLALSLFMYLLMARIVVSFIDSFVRDWRPRGAALVFASTVNRTTEPLLGWVRKVIPPVNFGGVQLDLSFILVFFVVSILKSFVFRMGVGLV
ncbi:YggT family protein [Pseudoglutamicibacter cumminsii]|uniref:YggT family protein n=1 Tax=Pseudoglutamicibacter cumminsii TaxID=156979 RepID=UPI001EF7C755|nr:YggT family protein [Pseudoglutamicibacter cumminsii]MBM7795131.1 YggT family protein [Pseudoglutamicibacter cumminsii]